MTTSTENYLSLDLWTSLKKIPIWNWDQISKGDYNYLFKDSDSNPFNEIHDNHKANYNILVADQEEFKKLDGEIKSLPPESVEEVESALEEITLLVSKIDSTIKELEKSKTFLESLEDTRISMEQEHLDEFGYDYELEQRITAMRKLIKYQSQFQETGDRSLLNLIEMEEEKLKGEPTGFKFGDVLEAVENYKKFNIDPYTYPAWRWFYVLKNMSNGKN